MSLRERLSGYRSGSSRLGGLVSNAYNSPYGGIRGSIYTAAKQEGIDPYLALATVENEGGFYDDLNEYYNRVGDQGQSFGPYQEHLKGRGAQAPRDVDPVRQTQRFAAEIRRLQESGFQGSPGQLIAAAQRPYDPIGAAQKYQASYERFSGGVGGDSWGPSSSSSAPSSYIPSEEAEGNAWSGPRMTPEQLARLRQANAAPQQAAGFGGVLGSLGRGIGAQLGAYGRGIQSIPENVQAMQENPIARNLPFGLGPALGVLSSLPTAEPLLEGAGVGELGGIDTPLGRLTGRGALGAVADPVGLLPLGKAGQVGGRLAGRGIEEVAQQAVGRFSPQTALRRGLGAIDPTDIAGERNARFIVNEGTVLGGEPGVLHADLAEQAGTSLDRVLQSGAVRIYNEGQGRVAVQVSRPLNPAQAQSLQRLLSGAREVLVEAPGLSASFSDPGLAVRRIQQSFGGVPQGRQGVRQLVGAEEGFARLNRSKEATTGAKIPQRTEAAAQPRSQAWEAGRQALEERSNTLAQRIADLQADYDSAASRFEMENTPIGAVARPPKGAGLPGQEARLGGLTDSELVQLAEQEGVNPYEDDWWAGIDSVAVKDFFEKRRSPAGARAGANQALRDIQTELSETEQAARKALDEYAAYLETEPSAAPASSNVPQWLGDELERHVQNADRLGLSDRIEELAAQRLTARQIANELRPGLGVQERQELQSMIRSVRAKRGIPSLDDTTEFDAWLRARQTTPSPSAAVPARDPEQADLFGAPKPTYRPENIPLEQQAEMGIQAPGKPAVVPEGQARMDASEAITEPLPVFERTPEAAAQRTEQIRQQRAAQTPEARQQRAIGHSQASSYWKSNNLPDPEANPDVAPLFQRLDGLLTNPKPTLDEINEVGARIAALREAQPTTEQLLSQSIEHQRAARGGGKPPEPPEIPPVAEGEAIPPTRGQRIANIANIPRALKSSFDLSAPLRQGAYFLPSRPTEWAKAFGSMVKAVGSEKYAQAVDDAISLSPFYEQAVNSGMYLAPRGNRAALNAREEAFMSDLASKIPILGKGVQVSERAYTTFLNKLRMEVFDTIAKEWGDVPAKNYESLANFVNAGTGRGRLGPLQEYGPLFNATFFSPRFFTSRIENVTNLADPVVRKQAANALWKFYGAGATAMGLLAAAGADVELDPRSSDFGKVKIGNTRYDFWAGYAQIARLMARTATALNPFSGHFGIAETKTAAGKIKKVPSIEIVGDFLRSKLAPLPATAVDVSSGENIVGEKVTPASAAIDALAPIFLQTMYEAGAEEGIPGLLKTSPEFVGVGVQTYGGSSKPTIGGAPRTAPAITTQPRAPVSAGAGGSALRDRINALR